jgi:thiosulfate/3-mercaptopyruvate sulfurtransferase
MHETPYQTILSPSVLFSFLAEENWAVVDCRFDLANPGWGEEEYQKSHILGAVYAHLDRDLSNPVTPQTGRHPLPDIDTFSKRLGKWGISNQTQVVVYDTTGGSYAARLWWMLRFLGHKRAALLDGGFTRWIKEGYPAASGTETRPEKDFHPHPDWEMVVDTATVEKMLQDPGVLLIDARAPERFRGEKEPIDPVAGHIPGAVNRFHGRNLDPEGSFLAAESLRKEFSNLLSGMPPEKAVVYCGSGVTSCHHLLAMEFAGIPGARLYAGSWSEWIRDPKHPIITG